MGLREQADPEAWTIVDGKLYLGGYKQDIEELNKDLAGNIQKAEAAWRFSGN